MTSTNIYDLLQDFYQFYEAQPSGPGPEQDLGPRHRADHHPGPYHGPYNGPYNGPPRGPHYGPYNGPNPGQAQGFPDIFAAAEEAHTTKSPFKSGF